MTHIYVLLDPAETQINFLPLLMGKFFLIVGKKMAGGQVGDLFHGGAFQDLVSQLIICNMN